MAIEDEAEECFARGFALLERLPETDSWKARLERIIETAMRMRGITEASIRERENGQSNQPT